MDVEEPLPEPDYPDGRYVPNYDLLKDYIVSLPLVLYSEQRLREMLEYSRSHYNTICHYSPCSLRLLIDEIAAVPLLHLSIDADSWVFECNPKNLSNLRSLTTAGYYGGDVGSYSGYHASLRLAMNQ